MAFLRHWLMKHCRWKPKITKVYAKIDYNPTPLASYLALWIGYHFIFSNIIGLACSFTTVYYPDTERDLAIYMIQYFRVLTTIVIFFIAYGCPVLFVRPPMVQL